MSYSIFVGRDLTADGVGFLAGYGDEPSSHWLEIIAAADHPSGSTIRVGVTQNAEVPGVLTHIPQAAHTMRHLRVSYSHYMGHPAPLTNGGLNEHGVAVRDVWSPSRPELVAMTPKDQSGPNYSDLAKLILERAHTAREGVELIAAIVGEHGHTTYGGNSHMIADANECWIVIEFAGGKGLWIAERLGPGSIRVSRPGYVGEVRSSADFLYSPNFFEFAVSMGWFDPASGAPFDANLIYGDGKGKWDGQRFVEDELLHRAATHPIAHEDMVWALRVPHITGDCAGYGQIVPLVGSSQPQLRLLWHAQIGPVAAPFVPVFLGVTRIPEEFQQHRYLSSAEDQRYYRAELLETPCPAVPLEIESRRSATYSFKRLYYLLLQDSDWTAQVADVWEAFEKRLVGEAERVRKTCEILLRCGEMELAASQLTYFTDAELRASLDWADELVGALDVRARALPPRSGVRKAEAPKQVW